MLCMPRKGPCSSKKRTVYGSHNFYFEWYSLLYVRRVLREYALLRAFHFFQCRARPHKGHKRIAFDGLLFDERGDKFFHLVP